ncbi:MAG: energy transducer TonB [Nitrospirae bacterium]|nr:energy transducer TonB [Nitrospirota bacterium]
MFLRGINTEAPVSSYNINIVGPVEEKKIPPPMIKENIQRPQTYTRKSISKKLLEETLPKTLFGEGIESKRRQLRNETDTFKKDTRTNASNPPIHPLIKGGLSGSGDTSPDKGGILPEGEQGLSQKPKSFLFDKETIEKYAQKNTEEAKGEKKGLTFDAPELQHRGYMKKLKEKIESIWKYPEEAARRGISGDLYIKFSIHKDGSLGEVELIRTSGYSDFDKAAIKALKEAAPYWPLPDDMKEGELSITGHFIYVFGTPYVM